MDPSRCWNPLRAALFGAGAGAGFAIFTSIQTGVWRTAIPWELFITMIVIGAVAFSSAAVIRNRMFE